MHATNPLDFLVQFLSLYQEGRAFLPHGRYEWKFETKSKPELVWLAEVNSGNMPVCQGGVNTFGVRYLDDGFVVVADVQDEFTEVQWQAYLVSSVN